MTDQHLCVITPPLDSKGGGVATSARGAIGGIKDQLYPRSVELKVLHYQKGFRDFSDKDAEFLNCPTKIRAVWEALRHLNRFDTLLFWHVDLIKLLPFLGLEARTVLFLHSIEVWRKLDLLTHWCLNKVNLFLTNTNYTWKTFLEYHPSYEDVSHQTVHLGIEEPLDRPIPEPTKKPSLLMLGRMSKAEGSKGHEEMIRAWPAVLKRLPECHLHVAGEGDLRDDLEVLAGELGADESITFHGWVSEEKKADLLEQSHCLALPSRVEGFGLVYLEAMRLGRPCLVSDCDAGREVVNPPEAGLAVNPDDFDALADAVSELVADRTKWEQWSQASRRRYEENFTEHHFQERLIRALWKDS